MGELNRLDDDPLWYKDAVFYEIYIRGFYHSNNDGIGDFRGLTEKLDYLQWLGVVSNRLPCTLKRAVSLSIATPSRLMINSRASNAELSRP